MVIPTEEHHISHKKAEKLKETTDMFGLPLRENEHCIVFTEGAEGFTGTKDIKALYGVIQEIEVFPTMVSQVTVKHYLYSEEERSHPEYTRYRDKKVVNTYYNKGVLGMTVLKEVRPEYFL